MKKRSILPLTFTKKIKQLEINKVQHILTLFAKSLLVQLKIASMTLNFLLNTTIKNFFFAFFSFGIQTIT